MAESKDSETNDDAAKTAEPVEEEAAQPASDAQVEGDKAADDGPTAKATEPRAAGPKKKRKVKKKRKAKKKVPGMFSFVAIRQYFMIFAAPGLATALIPVLAKSSLFGENPNFMVVMIIFAVPSLVHGQLWKWTYDWETKHHRNLRIGQIAIGALHVGFCIWALSRVATGEVPWEGGAFYHGLTIAGLVAGAWETVRPAMELRKSA